MPNVKAPAVTNPFSRPQRSEHFDAAMDRLALGVLSRRKAAKELGIGYATLKRLLDTQRPLIHGKIELSPTQVERNCNNFAEVLH